MQNIYQYELRRIRLCEPMAKVEGTEAAAELAQQLIGDADREYMLAVYLDNRLAVVGCETVAIGQGNFVEQTAANIFRGALVAGAASVVLAHNHPSGDPTPSQPDKQMASMMRSAGRLLGIAVLESIVVTRDTHRVIHPNRANLSGVFRI